MSTEQKIQTILEADKQKLGTAISFPEGRERLVEVQLALHVLEKNGMKILITIDSIE